MPPKWPRKPDRANDPAYRRLEDRINFAVHVAAFSAVNSGLWFVNTIKLDTLPWLKWFTLAWLGGLALHGVYVFAIAHYPDLSQE
ncbi:MAG: 2TM domain-containing protein [Cyanobacteria bacterium P01_G01_bin.38]